MSLDWNYKFNNTNKMFYGLDNIISIDLNDFDSGSIFNMTGMFYECTYLKNIIQAILIQKKVESMY